jgi:hypothetical protein
MPIIKLVKKHYHTMVELKNNRKVYQFGFYQKQKKLPKEL